MEKKKCRPTSFPVPASRVGVSKKRIVDMMTLGWVLLLSGGCLELAWWRVLAR